MFDGLKKMLGLDANDRALKRYSQIVNEVNDLEESIAILSDALHDFGDSLALGMAWYLEKVAAKESDRSYSYGYARFSVLGAFINSVVLIVGALIEIVTELVVDGLEVLGVDLDALLHPEIVDVIDVPS